MIVRKNSTHDLPVKCMLPPSPFNAPPSTTHGWSVEEMNKH